MAIALRCLAALVVAAGAYALHELVLEDDRVTDQRGAKVFTVSFESDEVGGDRLTKVVVPAGAPSKDRPLLVFLHGRGEDESSYLTEIVFTALERVGPKAPIVAFPQGGEASYWHDRDDGDWATYVNEEVLPRVIRRFEVDPERIAIGGISMGGYGAYNVARLAPGRYCAIGGHSPALWLDSEEAASGAFDDAGDFDRNDVIAAVGEDPSLYRRSRLWLDVGDDDPFAPAIAELANVLGANPGTRLAYKTRPGDHSNNYWNRYWHGYLRFYTDALNDCAKSQKAAPGRAGPGDASRRAGLGNQEVAKAGVDEGAGALPKKP